ncbi:cytochrome-c oxidase, cbb3-type subunit III [Rhodobacteraceae bacterium 2CG4]|uniref:Cbb3-type cytochrome c oxidase subunit n=1 Tax=Halovulum marinum TaxID=2662447 RepID=A0A6L5Z008_9RHOB|nr:cytochrome-c oxidase, cbb3-type subunit III [Halovulum marinum]MSU89609.1 cytochrome-c oxidase, cbb3-type subunit III [Halovulum marinum]
MARKLDRTDEMATTGHEWDGIREYDTPMPRWWLWTFYGTIAWSVIIMVLYPAIPLVDGATQGVLGYDSRAEVAQDIAAVQARNADLDWALEAAEPGALRDDDELYRYAVSGGRAVFATWCAQCHGAGGGGAAADGYPSLADNAWLWGGDIAAIRDSVAHGIRWQDDPDTRFSQMPAFGGDLSDAQIAGAVEHVRALSGQPHDAALAAAGAQTFAADCAACHGALGTGDRSLGAPDLTDAIWLYGGDRATLLRTVRAGRNGVMPAWAGPGRLTEAQIRQVAAYVHQLGGGE